MNGVTEPMHTAAPHTRKWVLFKLTLYLGAAFALLSCASINSQPAIEPDVTLNRYEYASIHMGSRCSIVLYAPTEHEAAASARAAFDEIARVEETLTDYRPDSESMRATSQPRGTWVIVSQILFEVLERSALFYELSNGAFDPTVGRFIHLWRHAQLESRTPSRVELVDAAYAVGFSSIQLDKANNRVRFMRAGIILDFGAIGKGFAADRALEILRSHGCDAALVDIGGDIAMGDPPPNNPRGWDVSVQSGNGAEWSTPLHSSAIATSGDLERHYEQNGIIYSHILDPRTGVGVTHRRAVTVIARDGTTADSVASIVSVLGEQIIPVLEDRFPGIRILIETRPRYDQQP